MRIAYLLKALRATDLAMEKQAAGDEFGAKWFGNLASFYLRLSEASV